MESHAKDEMSFYSIEMRSDGNKVPFDSLKMLADSNKTTVSLH